MTLLRLVTPIICTVLALAACSSASTVRPAPTSSNVVVVPRIAEPVRQLGIDIDFYVSKGSNVTALARQDIAYIKSLDANAVSIAIPFFSNPAGTTVGANNRTPTTSQLSELILAAERAGLAVTIRPLLDEKSIGETRVFWKPKNLTAWFAGYENFLLPYAALAQSDHVPVFVVGVEFTQFGGDRLWQSLDSKVRTVYQGTLAYSNNWTTFEHPTPGNGGTGVVEMTDAYPPAHLPDNASLESLTSAWTQWARPLPKGTVLSEVGIGSQPGAYLRPYLWGPTQTPLSPQIQVNWFSAACQTIAADDLGGLYFWTLNFGQSLTTPANLNDPDSFVDMPGQTAIAKCFSTLRADE
jgi:hypothetical protein